MDPIYSLSKTFTNGLSIGLSNGKPIAQEATPISTMEQQPSSSESIVIINNQAFRINTRSNPNGGTSTGPESVIQELSRGINLEPLNQTLYYLPFGPNSFIDYLLSRPDVQTAWNRHTHHEFLDKLADGTLPLSNFKKYLIQDYLYLVHFARANALAAYKQTCMSKIARSAQIILHIQRELFLHISYCAEFGIHVKEMEATPESPVCTAYTRYMLDVGMTEDWFALQVAMAPCLLGYGMIARRLFDDPKTKREGNRYWKWVKNYVAKDYTDAVKIGTDLLNEHAMLQSPSRIEALVKIFIHATNMEAGFWDMGLEGG